MNSPLLQLGSSRFAVRPAGRLLVAALLLAVPTACGGQSGAAGSGSTITITVGYQPMYAEAWSAVVIKQLDLWRSYLPKKYDVQVDWNAATTGAAVVNGMVGAKYDIGYTGDMPSINAMSNPGTKIVGTATTWSNGQQCGLLAVPAKSPIHSVRELRGRTIAVPVGSCLHFFLLNMLQQEGLTSQVTIKNMSPDAIQTGFRSGGFDVGVLQEPLTSRAIAAGDARMVTTGADYDSIDASNLLMTKDFYDGTGKWSSVAKVEGVSELAIAWQKANLAALNTMATDQAGTVKALTSEISDYPAEVVTSAIYQPVSTNPDVKRLHLDPDWRGSPAGTLLLDSGPKFLQGLDSAKGFDKSSAMQAKALELAARQLIEAGTTWPVLTQVGSGKAVDELALPVG